MSETIGRNDPCKCGSKKKYKKCCMEKDQAAEHAALEKKYKEALKAQPKPDEKAAAPAQKPGSHAQSHHQSQAPQHRGGGVAPKFNLPRRTGGA